MDAPGYHPNNDVYGSLAPLALMTFLARHRHPVDIGYPDAVIRLGQGVTWIKVGSALKQNRLNLSLFKQLDMSDIKETME